MVVALLGCKTHFWRCILPLVSEVCCRVAVSESSEMLHIFNGLPELLLEMTL